MPLTIAGIALLGWTVLGLGIAAALLCWAPLSPQLIRSWRVTCKSGRRNQAKRTRCDSPLTSEAGLNDGAAFPFVYLAIAVALSQAAGDQPFLANWFLVDVLWKIAAGVAIGWLGGKAMGFLVFRLPNRTGLSEDTRRLRGAGHHLS